jgi:AcrR family transcriptional regulator
VARSYDNAARAEKAEATRRALLDACAELLDAHPVEDVSIPMVAKHAGVTAPTAYKHFADHDALLGAFLAHLRGRIGMSHAAIAAVPPAQAHEIPAVNYALFEREARLLRRVMDSPSYDRVRLAAKIDRAGIAAAGWTGRTKGTSERALRASLGPIYLFTTPAAWRWLRDTWALDADEATRAAAWAMEVLGEALRKGRSVEKVDREEARHEDPSLHDAGEGPRTRGERARRADRRKGDPAAAPEGKRPRLRR